MNKTQAQHNFIPTNNPSFDGEISTPSTTLHHLENIDNISLKPDKQY